MPDPTPREEAMLQRLQALETSQRREIRAIQILAQALLQTTPGAIARTEIEAALRVLEEAL